MIDIKIITHPAHLGGMSSESPIKLALRLIGTAFGKDDEWAEKYGTDHENDIFMMHRYCWCEREGECPWCTGCGVYQKRAECRVCADQGLSVQQRRNAPPEDRCDYVTGRGIFSKFAPWTMDEKNYYYDPPNFWFKPTDFRLTWYKYIGRDMNPNNGRLPGDFLRQIFATHPNGVTVEAALKKYEHDQGKTEEEFAAMLQSMNVR